MGDKVGISTGGILCYIPQKECKRILTLDTDLINKAKIFSTVCRINTLYMIALAGSGHIGSSFSSLDIMSWLQLNELQPIASNEAITSKNIFFSSKGHDAPGLYSTMLATGKISFPLIHQLRRIGGLPGHPDISTPHIITNTGSLGMGISKAKGIIYGNRNLRKNGTVYVLMGDGELQEGQFWESLISAANHNLFELTVIVDHNKLQSDTLVSMVSDLGDLEEKLNAFGWHVCRCNGHSFEEISSTLSACKTITNKPKIIIADTIKGKGVSFMEHTSIDSDIELYKFHSGAPSEAAYSKAKDELIEHGNMLLTHLGYDALTIENLTHSAPVAHKNTQKLIQAYSKALLEEASLNESIVVLDADLLVDTGLLDFKKKFPNRFIECGIAEQDMVSQAGGISLTGLLPIVHSFSCFLSSRPNEQIYNNSTEKKKIIYVGSLAGLLPGGPGHSHQGIRDISSLSAIPGLILMEPSCEAEVNLLLKWAINENQTSSYVRLVSIPVEIPYELPREYAPVLGKGVTLKNGEKVMIISYGPVMLSLAYRLAKEIELKFNKKIKVVNLPWLNVIDKEWLLEEIKDFDYLFSLDNHFEIGGQGDRISNILAINNKNHISYTRYSAGNTIPAYGTNNEVLNAHGFNMNEMLKKISQIL